MCTIMNCKKKFNKKYEVVRKIIDNYNVAVRIIRQKLPYRIGIVLPDTLLLFGLVRLRRKLWQFIEFMKDVKVLRNFILGKVAAIYTTKIKSKISIMKIKASLFVSERRWTYFWITGYGPLLESQKYIFSCD